MSEKTCRLVLWVSDGLYGQRSRPCNVTYHVNAIGSHFLYGIDRVVDAWLPKEYSVASVMVLNGPMDEMIAAADPEQVEFAKKELNVDLKKPKPAKTKPKVIPFPDHPTLDLP